MVVSRIKKAVETPDCPRCGNAMILRHAQGERFWGCSDYPLCRKAIRWGETPETEKRRRAESILVTAEQRGGKTEVLAQRLRVKLETDPEKALPLILGDRTPGGKPTLEIALENESKERKTKRTESTYKIPKNPQKGIRLYTEQDRPEGPAFREIVIPSTGGPSLPASQFPYHELQHPELNPMQSAVLPWIDKDVNLVIATPTSTGKTTAAEIVMADALERNGKAIFLSPLRAVSQEKYDDWTSPKHPWSERAVEIVTGDYSLTEAKRKKLRQTDVIVMTSEMLDSKTRRMANEGNDWLLRTLCLVVDEAHLLTMEGRGDALEVGVMRFTRQNPHCRVVFLSATMPNVAELARWLTGLNGKPSVVISSTYRPIKLTVHWETYEVKRNYAATEKSKRTVACEFVSKYHKDKWIVFVHSKKAGRLLIKDLREDGEEARFHSADLNRDARRKIETDFRHGDLRIVVATSTLAYGINMPARRVLVLGIHRGMEEVDPIDVKQECGRAGRVGLDPEGDAYVLLPYDNARPRRTAGIRARFQRVGRIESQLNDVDVLAFHLTAEVSEGDVESESEAVEWHSRSLAAFQGGLLKEGQGTLSAANVMSKLERAGIFKRSGLRYTPTMLGRVSSWLYYSPFDVSDWAGNFRRLIELDRLKDDDCLAWALGSIRTAFKEYTPRDAEGDLNELSQRLQAKGITARLPGAVLAVAGLLEGVDYRALVSQQRSLAHDANRTTQAIELIDRHVLRALGPTYCELVGVRLRYGCTWKEADLCRLPGIGGKRARLLMEGGVRSISDVVKKRSAVFAAVGKAIGTKARRRAKEIMR